MFNWATDYSSNAYGTWSSYDITSPVTKPSMALASKLLLDIYLLKYTRDQGVFHKD